MAGQIGNVDGKTLRGESARQIRHDDPVGGEAVEKNGGAAFGIIVQAGFLDDVDDEGAGAGVDPVVSRGKAARGIEGENCAEEKKKDAGDGESRLFMFHAKGRLGELGLRGA